MKKYYVFDSDFYTESELSNISGVEKLDEMIAEDDITACVYLEEEYNDLIMNSYVYPFIGFLIVEVENNVVNKIH